MPPFASLGRRARVFIAALVTLSALSACSDPESKAASEARTILRITVDPTLVPVVARLRIVLEGRDAAAGSLFVPWSDVTATTSGRWPAIVPVAPLDGDATRIFRATVVALGSTGATPIVEARVIAGFVAGSERVVDVRLFDACRHVQCATPTSTCATGGRCADATRDTKTLAEYAPADVDAAVPRPPTCAVDNGGCGTGTCEDVTGGVRCACDLGYVDLSGASTSCADVDECAELLCGAQSVCTNVAGGFRCGDGAPCPSGTTKNGSGNCVEIDGCASSPCLHGGTCTTGRFGAYDCACTDGYIGGSCELAASCAPLAIANGTVTTTSTVVGGVATYACHERYALSGAATRTCTGIAPGAAAWSGTAPTCAYDGPLGNVGAKVGSRCTTAIACDSRTVPECMSSLKPFATVPGVDPSFADLGLAFPNGYCSNALEPHCSSDAECGNGGGCWRSFAEVTSDTVSDLELALGLFSGSLEFLPRYAACLETCTTTADCASGLVCAFPMQDLVSAVPGSTNDRKFCITVAGCESCDVNASCEVDYDGAGSNRCVCNVGHTGNGLTCTP